jgi:6,7-dimethyl-8-ribityllumazine synthase
MQRKQLAKKAPAGDASALWVGIAVARFNEDITEALLSGAREMLKRWGVRDTHVHIMRVNGSFELPFAVQRLIVQHKVDAAVALGCIIKGDTKHDEYIAQAVFNGLTQVALEQQVPVGLGVLTTKNLAQARARAGGDTNHGAYAAEAALQAALLE